MLSPQACSLCREVEIEIDGPPVLVAPVGMGMQSTTVVNNVGGGGDSASVAAIALAKEAAAERAEVSTFTDREANFVSQRAAFRGIRRLASVRSSHQPACVGALSLCLVY